MTLRVPLSEAERRGAQEATVCVTGGAGYIAAHVVHRLLSAGFKVRATVRDAKKADFLTRLPNADQNLSLHEADLLKPGAFDSVVEGCKYVFHTASPFVINPPKGKEEETLIKPALKGTENVLNAVNKSTTVERVVLTSSVFAVWGDCTERGKDHTFTEEDWNKSSTLSTGPYHLSKKVAEEAAWDMCKQQSRWTMVAMCPGAVYGPPLSSRMDGESVTIMSRLLKGEMWPAAPPFGMAFVDVRDVAAGHVRAAVEPGASGRYLLTSESGLLFHTTSEVIKKRYPGKFKLPIITAPYPVVWLIAPLLGIPRPFVRSVWNKIPKVNSSKAQKDLGISFIGVKETILDMVEGMAAQGLIKP